MAGSAAAHKVRYMSTYAGLVWGSVRKRLQTGPVSRWRIVGRNPDRLLYSPSCIRPSDPLIARDIYEGRFTFAGHTIEAGTRSIFEVSAPSHIWAINLHSFTWLRHLQHAGTELAAENGRALVDDWINISARRITGPAWEPQAVAARVIAWIQHARFILQNSEHGFYRRFMTSLSRQVRYLRVIAAGCDETNDLLHVRIALCYAALNLPSTASTKRRAAANLEDQLKRQIMADGGHISRNPHVLPEILADLLPLAQVFVADSKPIPNELMRALDRMFPMLRFFRHAGGALAHFHGAGFGRNDLATAVLHHDGTNGKFTEAAVNSGFQRLSAGNTVIIADVGAPVSGIKGRKNHASTLSFEFSSGRSQLVVNAGVDRHGREMYETAARMTAAHSTLVLDDCSSSEIAEFRIGGKRHNRVLEAPSVIDTQPWKTDAGNGFSARHNGYVKKMGLWHERGILLSDSGLRIDGYDRLTPHNANKKGAHRADIRFHLHPRVAVRTYTDDNALELTNDAGEVWRFSAKNAVPTIEESVFFAGIVGPVYNKQIVLRFSYPDIKDVTWRFQRL